MKLANFNLFPLIFFNLGCASTVSNNSHLIQEYSYSPLTPSYGILSAKDLEYDLENQTLEAYNSKKSQALLFWQCFEVKNVKHNYRSWRDTTDGGLSDNFCDLKTWAERDGETHVYVNRRALPLDRCREYVNVWNNFTKSEQYVCFDGRNFGESEENILGVSRKVHIWQWERFKTRKGCYAYFPGDCAGINLQKVR